MAISCSEGMSYCLLHNMTGLLRIMDPGIRGSPEISQHHDRTKTNGDIYGSGIPEHNFSDPEPRDGQISKILGRQLPGARRL